jgi:tetratricopeptide (TPR) repeat protein
LEPAQAAIPEALLRIAAPVYTAPALRLGVGGDDRFRTGMEQYREGHYTEAIPELVAATDANAKSADAQFFLGICYLMDGQTSSAVMRLRATIALGESLDLELAHFYLAKALLRANDVPGARNALENTIALHGDLEREAQDMLSQLRELPRPRSK